MGNTTLDYVISLVASPCEIHKVDTNYLLLRCHVAYNEVKPTMASACQRLINAGFKASVTNVSYIYISTKEAQNE